MPGIGSAVSAKVEVGKEVGVLVGGNQTMVGVEGTGGEVGVEVGAAKSPEQAVNDRMRKSRTRVQERLRGKVMSIIAAGNGKNPGQSGAGCCTIGDAWRLHPFDFAQGKCRLVSIRRRRSSSQRVE
jgi:hypothetical protein